MDLRILYLTLSTLQVIRALCWFSKNQCKYTFYCQDSIDCPHSSELQSAPNKQYQDVECQPAVTFNGHHYYNVELVLEQQDMSLKLVPELRLLFHNYYCIDIITSLDLSHNKNYMTPSIITMINLAKLNLSRNYLTTAVLSNVNKLSRLSEIDLSHNMISTILVKRSEQPYTNLTKINISHNQLMKIDDKTFNKFKVLQKVNLSHNFIGTITQKSFEYNKNLTELDISNNLLVSANLSLANLNQLKYLNVSRNKIENIQPNEFERLVKLETLDLSYNAIKEINVNVLQNTIRLKNIDLSNNLLESIDNKTFSNLRSLSTINVSRNKLKSLPVGLFKNNILSYILTANKLEGSLVKGMLEHVDAEKLDFSYTCLTEIQNYAFYNLTKLKVLLLNYNRIKTLSNNSFATLINLDVLNLSDNQISNLNFNKKDLANLQSLFLQNNRLAEINYKQFEQLINLKQLNLSGNYISHIGLNIFRSLKYLMNFDISNNSLVGTLESNTFDGLDSIPILDISHCMLTTIKNASFNDMTELNVLNISRCVISELQYNAFINTRHIKIIDLSYNKMQNFAVNTSGLMRLKTLLLNNNLIKTISIKALNKFHRLQIIDLSHNEIKYLSNSTDLTHHDNSSSNELLLSDDLTLTEDEWSLTDDELSLPPDEVNRLITKITLYTVSLKSLNLSNNNISILRIEDFMGCSLKHLDLSSNKISLIQPGVFRSNNAMISLNISHNLLATVNYGIFRGLDKLDVLNISYNNLRQLQSETFFDTKNLTRLIVDFNEIESINTLETFSTHLKELSIGDNPLSCETLVKHERSSLPLKITSIRISEHGQENVNGVVCNKFRVTKPTSVTDNNGDKYIYSELLEVSKDMNQKLSKLENNNNYTNILLDKIRNSCIKYSDFINNSKSQSLYIASNQNTKSFVTEVCVVLILLILISIVLYYFSNSRLLKNKFNYTFSAVSENEENSTL